MLNGCVFLQGNTWLFYIMLRIFDIDNKLLPLDNLPIITIYSYINIVCL